jgi:hypothetical protein
LTKIELYPLLITKTEIFILHYLKAKIYAVIKKLMSNKINFFKITLCILLLLCLFDMPYGFYQLIRFVALVGFSLLAYQYRENKIMMLVFISLALLFQPFFKISLGRTLWNIVDVLVALFLLISLKLTPKNQN